MPYRVKALLGYTNSDLFAPSHNTFWSYDHSHRFLQNEYFRIVFEGGVFVLPKKYFGPIARLRIGRRPLLSAEIVGVAQALDK